MFDSWMDCVGVSGKQYRTKGQHSTVEICAMVVLYRSVCLLCAAKEGYFPFVFCRFLDIPRTFISISHSVSSIRSFFYMFVSFLTSSRQTNEVNIISFMDFVINVARTVNVLVPLVDVLLLLLLFLVLNFAALRLS